MPAEGYRGAIVAEVHPFVFIRATTTWKICSVCQRIIQWFIHTESKSQCLVSSWLVW